MLSIFRIQRINYVQLFQIDFTIFQILHAVVLDTQIGFPRMHSRRFDS